MDISDRVYQSTLMRALSRYWRSELSDREYTTLAYIMDHTVEWGRLAYQFTYKSLAEGTPVSPCGLNKGEQQLREILLSLERKGAVSVARGRDGLAITFNPQWRPAKSPRKRSVDAATPSEIQGVDPWQSKGQTLGNPHPLLEEQLEQQDKGALRPANADRRPGSFSKGFSISEPKIVSIPVRKRTKPTRLENPTAEPTRSPGQYELAAVAIREARRSMRSDRALYETWEAAYDGAYAGVPGAGCVTWSKAEMAMVVTQLAKPFKGTSPELHEFVDWIVTNWSLVMVEQFRWMKRERPPELPSLRFVLAFKDKFFAAYGRRSVDRYLDSLSDHERTIRNGLLRDGLTAQQADVRLAERRARGQLRNEMEKREAKAAQALRTAATERGNLVKERRAMEAMLYSNKQRTGQALPAIAPRPPAREVSDEELAQSVQLVAKMMEVDPDGD